MNVCLSMVLLFNKEILRGEEEEEINVTCEACQKNGAYCCTHTMLRFEVRFPHFYKITTQNNHDSL